MEIDIKQEKNFLCYGCLSNDRQISPLGDNADMFYNLIGIQKHCLSYVSDITNDVMLCWECRSVLRKIKIFQSQILVAQNVLSQFSYGVEPLPKPLSKLVTITKAYCDHEMNYEPAINETSKNDESMNEEIEIKQEDVIDDSENIVGILKREIDDLCDEMLHDKAFEQENDVKTEIVAQDDNSLVNDDMNDDFTDVGTDEGHNFDYQIEEEPVDCEIKKTKPKKIKKAVYKNNSVPIKATKTDWGDFESYFNMKHYDEKEYEQNIVAKERRNLKRYKYKVSCSICKLRLRDSVDLNRHNDLNHRKEGAPFKCSFCHTTVTTETEFKFHWRTHTLIAKCKLCECVLRPREMLRHLNYKHISRYACKRCDGKFGTLSAFEKHYQDNHMNFVCDYCNMSFRNKPKIAKHIKETHEPVFCKECNKTFVNRKRYEAHCQLLHPELTNGEKIADEDCYCVECNKQYKTIQQYREHLNYSIKHVDSKKGYTQCPECGKVFAKRSYMNNHYNLFHLKKTKFHCQLCDKYFTRGYNLRVHNRDVHEKVPKIKDKVCDLCGRAFTAQRIMLNHRRTHTGERPYKCLYCTAQFIQKHSMTVHMRSQHKHFNETKPDLLILSTK